MGARKSQSVSVLTRNYLQSLSYVQYEELIRNVYERELKRTGSEIHAHNIIRRIKKKRQPYGSTLLVKKELLLFKPKPSLLLDTLLPRRMARWIDPKKRTQEITLDLTKFSLIDYPEETMDDFEKLVLAESVAADTKVNFTATDVTDVAPYLMLGIMRSDMMPFMSGGKINDPIRQILDAVQLSKFLGITRFMQKQGTPLPLYPFPLRRRNEGSSTDTNVAKSPSTKEKVTDDFVDTINYWLLQLTRQLSESSRWRVARLIGEVLDNAERHSREGGDGGWTIAGFMVKRYVAGQMRYTCHLAIVSVGKTIAETMLLADQQTKTSLSNYLLRHRVAHLTEENAATIFALQDGISRIPQGEELSSGGVGMMEIVTMANSLGGSSDEDPIARPQVTIFSGNTIVQFRGDYENGVMFSDGRRFQWFNSANSIDYPPDGRHVFTIRQRFPGTVIAVRFSFDVRFLQDNERNA